MKDLLVVMPNSTGEQLGTMARYREQLSAAGIDHHVQPIPDPDGTIGFRLNYTRVVRNFSHYRHIVFTDAFDVQFFGTKEQVIQNIPSIGVILAAEKNCHPPECLSLNIPDKGPWKFANGGAMAGTPENILAWCDAVERHPLYRADKIDQGLLNELLAEGSDLAPIDWRTELFFCLYGGYEELEFEDKLPVNRTFNTTPNFIHANGGWSTSLLEARMK